MNTDNESAILVDPDKALISKLNTRQPKASDPNVVELMESIRSLGQVTPAIARPHPTKPGCYELAAGACRKVACKALKRPLRLIVREIPDADFEDMILTENLQRKDPEPMQEARLIERRLKAGALPSEIAARYGKTETWIKRRMKLAALVPEARDAWGEGGAFFHFNTEMMEFVGTLPPEVQKDLADDPYKTREFGSLKELIEGQNSEGESLKDVKWLHDPVSFVDGCGPGCATDTAQSLFPDPDHPCGTCLNGDCFRKREALVRDAKITALLDGREITDFLLVSIGGYCHGITYQGKEIKVRSGWEMDQHYTVSKKPDKDAHLAIDFKDKNEPKIVYLKSRAGKKSGAAAPGKQESRESKLTGKRTAAMQGLLLEHLEKAPVPETARLFDLLVAFGTVRNRSTCMSDSECQKAWGSYHAEPGKPVEELDFRGKSRSREEVAWLAVKPVLRQRLFFQKNNELLTDYKSTELRQIAALTSFPWEDKWREVCTKTIPVPKSWGPGIDPITLKSPGAKPEPAPAAKKAAKKKPKKNKAA